MLAVGWELHSSTLSASVRSATHYKGNRIDSTHPLVRGAVWKIKKMYSVNLIAEDDLMANVVAERNRARFESILGSEEDPKTEDNPE